MVEKEGHLTEVSGVKNLEGVIAWINPPPSKTHRQRIASSFKSLVTYVTSKGDLPPSFRPFRVDNGDSRLEGHLIDPTHVSGRDWGWVGRHNYIAFVRLENDFSITAVAVLRSEAPIRKETYIAGKRLTNPRSKSDKGRRVPASGKLPRFRI